MVLSLLMGTVQSKEERCVEVPSLPDCAGYEYPEERATEDVGSLCSAMPFMPACTIQDICASSPPLHSDPYCAPFSILADGCASDMPGMSGCSSYVSLCSPPDSVVQQCEALPPIAGLPTTAEADQAIKELCGSHPMPGCEKCDLSSPGYMDCDLLRVYSEICLGMPDMAGCAGWKEMCETIPGWGDLCPSSDPSFRQPPVMRMYFHTGYSDYILFESWVPRDLPSYVGSIAAIVALVFLFEALQTWCAFEEETLRKGLAMKSGDATKEELFPLMNKGTKLVFGALPVSFSRHLSKSLLRMVEVCLGYFIMLIFMTFNVGLYVSLLVAFFFAYLVIGRYRKYTAAPFCCK